MWVSTALALSIASLIMVVIYSRKSLRCANGEISGTQRPIKPPWIFETGPPSNQFKQFKFRMTKASQTPYEMCLYLVSQHLAAKKTPPDNPQNYAPDLFLELHQSDAGTRIT